MNGVFRLCAGMMKYTDQEGNMFEIRAIQPEEIIYTLSQSSSLRSMTGNIGILEAEVEKDAEPFVSTWLHFRDDLNTQEFRDELDVLMFTLRSGAGDHFLMDRKTLSEFCNSGKVRKILKTDAYSEFGVRVESDKYVYLMRLAPEKEGYDLCCYCYIKKWLDNHIKDACKGIRFIDPHYKERFRLKDGGKIKLIFSDGYSMVFVCRYLDDYHFELGGNNHCYHICEFAERMHKNGTEVVPFEGRI